MSNFLTICGLIGNALFAIAALPTAFATWKKGASVGTPVSLAWQIFIACLTFYTYLLGTHGFDLIVATNAVVETSSWGTILWFHYRPRG